MTHSSGGTHETILLVEDHSALLKLVKQILEDAGFSVLPAKNAREALRLEADFPGTIHLLLSDVRMRGTSGPDLAQKLQHQRPRMRVVLMSGYPVAAAHHFGWHYIQKPFAPSALVDRVRIVLRGDSRSSLHRMAAGSASPGAA